MTEPHARDLFGYLFDLYLKECQQEGQPASLDKYLAFARRHLISNPPTTIRYLASGLGVQLRSGQVLAFTPDQLGMNVMRDEGLAIIQSAASAYVRPSEANVDTSISLAVPAPAPAPEPEPIPIIVRKPDPVPAPAPEPLKAAEAPKADEPKAETEARPPAPPRSSHSNRRR